MSVLHIINKSPFERSSLQTCLRLAKKGSGILLIEDGVYAAMNGGECKDEVVTATGEHKLYALQADLDARGIKNIIDGISLVDYDGFVKLTTEHDKVQSWL